MKKYIIEIKTRIYVEAESEQDAIEKYNNDHYEKPENYYMTEQIFQNIKEIKTFPATI